MRAFTYKQYGSPDVLQLSEVRAPRPGARDVLIEVHATTVSSGDWRARSLIVPSGMGLIARLVFGIFGPRQPILGTELSGEVIEVGSEVTRFQPGDAVIAFTGTKLGAHAEYVVMSEKGAILPKPAQLTHEEAASLPFGGTTAYDFLVNKAGLKAGQRVLVNGATGATGSAAVQIAHYLGAEVTAVCSAKNAELARSLGAQVVIDYAITDFAAEDQRYDMIVDTVGTAPLRRARRALIKGGTFVMISGSFFDMVLGALRARITGHRMIAGVASEAPEVLEAVVALADKGVLRPVIDRAYPFEELVAAHRHVDTGHKIGTVVVAVAA